MLQDRVKEYAKYAIKGQWEENTDNSPFPSVLLVFSRENNKRHIFYYAKGHLQKTHNDSVSFFVTTKNQIKFCKDKNKVWQAVK